MIALNDLYDLYYTFVLIRADIHYGLNYRILDEIEQVIIDECYSDNVIRTRLAAINSIDSKKWNFVFHNNVYVYTELLKDKNSLSVIAEMCRVIKKAIEAKDFERASEFVDAFHYIPLLIVKNKKAGVKTAKKRLNKFKKKWRAFNT